MVSHVGSYDGDLVALRQPGWREVQCLVEPVRPPAPHGLEVHDVVQGGLGIHHGRERGGVGRDHDVLEQPPLESQPGHAEVRVLEGEMDVADIVGGLGDPPWHAPLLTVSDLPSHYELTGQIQQAAGGLLHHEERHQILEHRSRPRHERRTATHRRERSPQKEPMPRRHVTLGDRDEARQPRLRCEQVVAAGVERVVTRAEADGKQIARAIEQEAEVHRLGQPFRLERDGGETMVDRARHRRDLVEHVEVARVTADGFANGGRPCLQFRSRLVTSRRQRADDVQQVLRAGVHLLEPGTPFVGGPRRVLERRRHRVQRLAHLRGRHDLGAHAEGRPLERLTNGFERIANPVQDLRPHCQLTDQLTTSLRKRDQMPGEIPTVHR